MTHLNVPIQLQSERYVQSVGPGRFDKVVATSDVLGADGRLLVQSGARGWRCASGDQGRISVLFASVPSSYVALDASGRRYQSIPSGAVIHAEWTADQNFETIGRAPVRL